MKTIVFLANLIIAVSVVSAAPPKDITDTTTLLEPIRAEHNLPALAAAVISNGEVDYNSRKLLKIQTIKDLRKPYYDGDYAGGWGIVDRPWGGGRVFTHSGSNNQNYAVVWMATNKNFAVIIATNQGGSDEAKALDQVASALIRKIIP